MTAMQPTRTSNFYHTRMEWRWTEKTDGDSARDNSRPSQAPCLWEHRAWIDYEVVVMDMRLFRAPVDRGNNGELKMMFIADNIT